jgi:hypothetical protein
MADILSTASRSAYDIAFQVSPIVLFGGLYPSGMPILGLLSGVGQAVTGAASGIGALAGEIGGLAYTGLNLIQGQDPYFARFMVMPGGTLLNNAIGKYPFANVQVAANATIQQPKNVSLRMICPAKGDGYYLTKLAIMTGLQTTLEQHNAAGGYYTVATPSFIYTNGILTNVTDITPGNTANPQTEWQFDFEFPLISQDQATGALNTLMSQVSAGQQPQPGVFQNVQTFGIGS